MYGGGVVWWGRGQTKHVVPVALSEGRYEYLGFSIKHFSISRSQFSSFYKDRRKMLCVRFQQHERSFEHFPCEYVSSVSMRPFHMCGCEFSVVWMCVNVCFMCLSKDSLKDLLNGPSWLDISCPCVRLCRAPPEPPGIWCPCVRLCKIGRAHV